MKNNQNFIFYPFLILVFSLLLNSCKPEETTASIETSEVTLITEASAECGGFVTSVGSSNVTARGVCWSKFMNPTISDSITSDSSGAGKFTSKLTGLTPGTTYYISAYSTNEAGTSYGRQTSFTTKVLKLNTSPISFISATSATSGGVITSDGDSNSLTISARGVCWNTFPNPTIDINRTTNGKGSGTFTSTITGLEPFTTYFLKSYILNSKGVTYGNEISFTTLSGVIGLTTVAASSITATTAISGGAISTDGGESVTERGVCWSTNPNPSTSDNKTNNGSGEGPFTSNIIGLSPGITYYLRSFATNIVGTCYGNEVSFSTPSGIIDLTTTTVSSIKAFSANCSGTITSDGGGTITEHGFCWNSSPKPTITNSKTTTIGSGTGSFTSSINGLQPVTTYYIRSYATNSTGTFYGDELIFKTLSGSVKDIAGNVYNVVAIGSQEWLVENLKTNQFNDGTMIPNVSDPATWDNQLTPGYCWYNNSITNKNPYGALYNWYAVNTNKLAPIGWHIPTKEEWTILTNYLKDNEYGYVGSGSGFAGLPGGCRANGNFTNIGTEGYYWSSTQLSTTNACRVSFTMDYSFLYSDEMSWGFSVRCIRD